MKRQKPDGTIESDYSERLRLLRENAALRHVLRIALDLIDMLLARLARIKKR